MVVGLIVALHALSGEGCDPATAAKEAHDVEAVDLGLQSGIQDQIAAAYGGAILIEMPRYPEADAHRLDVSPALWDTLERHILTVYLGTSRHSTAVHDAVISHLADADANTALAPLRAAAQRAAAALVGGTIEDYGGAMIANTEAQAALHPALVNPRAREVISLARRHEALGWKVNGAGGTVTVLASQDSSALARALTALDEVVVLPLRPARHGARVVESHA